MSDESYQEYVNGLALLEREEFEKALVHLYRSLNLNTYFKTCQRIAQALYGLSRVSEAEEYTEKAFILNPANCQVITEYAELLIKRGLEDCAKDILDDILRRNPSYGPAKRLLLSLESA